MRVCFAEAGTQKPRPPFVQTPQPAVRAREFVSRNAAAGVAVEPPPRRAAGAAPQPPRGAAKAAFAAAVADDVEALGAGGDVASAARRGLPVAPRFALNAAVSRLGARGSWAAALRLLRWMTDEQATSIDERADSHTFVAFFGCCGAGPSLDAARGVWRACSLLRARLSAGGEGADRVRAAYLACLARAGEADEAFSVFEALLRSSRGDMRTSVYNAALGAAAGGGGEPADASALWDALSSSPTARPNALSLALAVTACRSSPEAAMAVATSPAALSTPLDAQAAGCVVAAAARAGRLDVARAYWLAAVATPGVALTTRLCNAYLSALASVGHSAEAERIHASIMCAPGSVCPPDVITLTELVRAASRSQVGPRDATHAAIARLLASPGCEPTHAALTVMLTALGDAGEWRKAEAVAADWEARFGLAPNTRTSNALVRAHLKSRRFGGGVAVFRDAQRRGIMPDAATFHQLLAGCDAAVNDLIGCDESGEEWGEMEVAALAVELRTLRDSLTLVGSVKPAKPGQWGDAWRGDQPGEYAAAGWWESDGDAEEAELSEGRTKHRAARGRGGRP